MEINKIDTIIIIHNRSLVSALIFSMTPSNATGWVRWSGGAFLPTKRVSGPRVCGPKKQGQKFGQNRVKVYMLW